MTRAPSTTAGGLSAENARGRGDRTSVSYNDRGAVVLRSSDRRLRGPPLTAERTTTTTHADAPRPTHSRVAKRARRASARATRKRNPPTGVRGHATGPYGFRNEHVTYGCHPPAGRCIADGVRFRSTHRGGRCLIAAVRDDMLLASYHRRRQRQQLTAARLFFSYTRCTTPPPHTHKKWFFIDNAIICGSRAGEKHSCLHSTRRLKHRCLAFDIVPGKFARPYQLY